MTRNLLEFVNELPRPLARSLNVAHTQRDMPQEDSALYKWTEGYLRYGVLVDLARYSALARGGGRDEVLERALTGWGRLSFGHWLPFARAMQAGLARLGARSILPALADRLPGDEAPAFSNHVNGRDARSTTLNEFLGCVVNWRNADAHSHIVENDPEGCRRLRAAIVSVLRHSVDLRTMSPVHVSQVATSWMDPDVATVICQRLRGTGDPERLDVKVPKGLAPDSGALYLADAQGVPEVQLTPFLHLHKDDLMMLGSVEKGHPTYLSEREQDLAPPSLGEALRQRAAFIFREARAPEGANLQAFRAVASTFAADGHLSPEERTALDVQRGAMGIDEAAAAAILDDVMRKARIEPVAGDSGVVAPVVAPAAPPVATLTTTPPVAPPEAPATPTTTAETGLGAKADAFFRELAAKPEHAPDAAAGVALGRALVAAGLGVYVVRDKALSFKLPDPLNRNRDHTLFLLSGSLAGGGGCLYTGWIDSALYWGYPKPLIDAYTGRLNELAGKDLWTTGFGYGGVPARQLAAKVPEIVAAVARLSEGLSAAARAGLAFPEIARAAAHLGLPGPQLQAELTRCSHRALAEDWFAPRAAIGATQAPTVRWVKSSDGPADGRLGIDLAGQHEHWKPSLFLGVLYSAHNHGTRPSQPALGADFVTIVSVNRNDKAFDGDHFIRTPEFTELRKRLRVETGGWDLVDVLEQPKPNLWHPIHLRRPLAEVLAGCSTEAARYAAWMAAAREGVDLVLRGGELAALARRWRESRGA